MAQIEDFFLSSNTISSIPEEKYEKIDILIDSFDAISRMVYKSLYIIDYYKKKFLYVSNNPLFLCGHSAKEVLKLGYMFYLNHISEQEQAMLTEINRAGFEFYDKISVEERLDYTISYNFHLMADKKEILVNHKLTPICLTDDGKIWLAACIVSLPAQSRIGNIEMHKKNEATIWKYSLESHCWQEDKGVNLGERERDILSLSAQGYTMKEIADKLYLSLDTIKFYKRKLFEKLEVKSITEAIAFAQNHKLF
jgi:DNA-binding CsgD family transcriptional regulator